MNFLWLVQQQEHVPAAAQAAEHAAESPNVFALTPGVSGWTLIIFILLMVTLIKFAFPPILGFANAREKRIQDALDESKRQQEETAKLLEQQRAELIAARTEAQGIIVESRQAGERLRQELLNKARAEQEDLIARAKLEIVSERDKAIEAVRQQAVELALSAAARLIDQKLDAESDRKIVNDFLARLGDQPAAGAPR
jgi:F-type H+-transporting ATPase subunit b